MTIVVGFVGCRSIQCRVGVMPESGQADKLCIQKIRRERVGNGGFGNWCLKQESIIGRLITCMGCL